MDNAQNGYSSADNTGKIKKKCIFLQVLDCYEVDSESVVKHSSETILVGDRYEIV